MKMRWILSSLILCALLVTNVANLTAEENWTRKADMPTVRSSFSTCVVDGKIYAIGGEIDRFGDMGIATVEMYDPKSDTWHRKADMPTARSGVSISVVDGKIYAIGGAKKHKRRIGPGWGYDIKELATVEMYDPTTDTWIQKADMPTPRSTNTCVVEGKIYAIGGSAPNNIKIKKPWRLKTVEVYDPATDMWAKGRSMNSERSGAAMSVVDGKIYAMGGTGWPQIPFHPGPFLSSVEVFNPKTNQWREIGEMPEAKSGHTATAVNGKIYVMGGFFRGDGRDFRYLSTIDIYDPERGRWTQKPDMPVGKSGHTAEVIRGKIYVFGGRIEDAEEALLTVEVYDTGEFPQSVDPTGKLVKTWGSIKKSGIAR